MTTDLTNISDAVKNGDQFRTIELVKEKISDGTPAGEILEGGLVHGIQALGDLFKDGQVFLPEILISMRAMNAGLDELKPRLKNVDIPNKGTVVLGTVQGDLHDIGKNLVGMLLKGNGYRVVDLGVDVEASAFCEAARNNNAEIVALSGLLTSTMPYFINVIEALTESGLRDSVKVMIGGAPTSREYADKIGAEGFAEDCITAVDEANSLMGTA